MRHFAALLTLVAAFSLPASLCAEEAGVKFVGKAGPGLGKNVVLISGDEEYRSEETLPQLGKILAERHGFTCTVLFAIDKTDGTINPNQTDNIPGLEALADADLMVIFTRFRKLPDDQMKHIDTYVKAGKPVIGIRTATHAFNVPKGQTYSSWSHNNNTESWKGGFGREILGETWISHHGGHGKESQRGILTDAGKAHPILRGIKDGDIWGPDDVYGVRLPLPTDCEVLVLGQVLTGMKSDDPPVEGKKNDPMMPIIWSRTLKSESGNEARIVTSTMGCAQDMESAGYRRMLVNAAYWCVKLEEKIKPDANVDLVGEYHPLPFKSNGYRKNVKPADHAAVK